MRQLLLVFLLFFSIKGFPQKVIPETAKIVAVNWYRHYAPSDMQHGNITKTVEYKYRDATNFYIFSFDKGGFVMVSANNQAEPILGYGFEGNVPDKIDHPAVKGMFDGYARQIDSLNYSQLKSATINPKWEPILKNQFLKSGNQSVGPLLKTTWDQGWPYNILCPETSLGSGSRMPVGCTAVALGQVLKYWNYPDTGIGHQEYAWNEQNISESFNEKPYNFSSMPNSLNIVESTVPLLLYHSGVASSMNYTSDGSGAYLQQARNALVEHFDYDSTAQFRWKWAPTITPDDIWENMIRVQLDKLQPVIYAGYGSSGHAWVVDGYEEMNYFHINWGWGGQLNAYYLLSNLTNIGFPKFHEAIFDVKPKHSPLKAEFSVENGKESFQKLFYDFSKGFPDARSWDFGDGTTSNLINPLHSYIDTGTYVVTLVIDKNGFKDTISKSIKVTLPYFTDINQLIAEGIEGLNSYELGDFNDDGYLDVLIQYLGYVNGARDYYTTIFQNMSGENFRPVDAGLPKINFGAAKWGDFNNDNNLDCSIYGYDYGMNKQGGVYLNKNGKFFQNQPLTKIPTGWGGNCALGDLDNDGDLELIIKDQNGKTLQLKNKGSFFDVDSIFYSPGYANICDLNVDGKNELNAYKKFCDFDGDGDLDILGDNLFINNNNSLTPMLDWGKNIMDWGDFDNDGDVDILITSTVFRNDNGKFMDLELNLKNAIGWFDFDNDGDLDIIYLDPGVSYSNMKILRNNTNPNGKVYPTIISKTKATGNQVTITWNRLILPANQAGYTYNLYIGKTESTTEILSPMADLTTGFRKIAACGNVSCDTTWSINNIPNGSYYYGLQLIDANYKGSPFISKGSFSIAGVNLPAELLPVNKDEFVHLPLTFSQRDFESCYSDPEKDPISQLKIISVPKSGQLTFNNNPVSVGTTIPVGSLSQLQYKSDTLANDQFQWSACGTNGLYSKEPSSVIITVYPLQKLDKTYFDVKSSASGDYDNDLDLDLLIGNQLFENNGGNFDELVFTIPYDIRSSKFVDLDGDGKMDIVAANDDKGLLFYFNVNNTFILKNVNVPEIMSPRYAFGDFNADGFVDFILSGTTQGSGTIAETYKTTIYLNDKTGKFNVSPIALLPVRAAMFCAGDLNNDGYVDLIMAGETNSEGDRIFKVLFNDKSGGLIESDQDFSQLLTRSYQEVLGLTGLSNGSLDLGDVDQDGDLDLLLCGSFNYIYTGSETSFTALLINSDGHFIVHNDFWTSNIKAGQVRFIDLNMDGKPDIVLNGYKRDSYSSNPEGGTKNESKIFLNNFPAFKEISNNLPGLYASSYDFGDLDNDGDMDVVLSGFNSETSKFQTEIFKNTYNGNTYIANQPPSVPTKLTNNIERGYVKLQWSQSTDNTTPVQSVSYNIIMNKVNSPQQLCSPLVINGGSSRILEEIGNAGFNNFYKLDIQPKGKYVWKVQTIDNSFVPSAFSLPDTINFEGYPEVYDTTLTIGPQGLTLRNTLFENLFKDYEGDKLKFVKITQSAKHNNILFAGKVLAPENSISVDSLNLLQIIPETGFFGNDSLSWKGSDGANFTDIPAKLKISVQLFQETSFSLDKYWGNGAVSFGDLDNDANLDIAINATHQTAGWNRTLLYSNFEGNLNLLSNTEGKSGRNLILWNDYDNDNDLDYSTSTLFIYGTGTILMENLGSTTFNKKFEFDGFGSNLYWGDFNGDNNLDIPSRYTLFIGDGHGQVNSLNCMKWNVYGFNNLIWCDIDNDGPQDLILSSNGWPARQTLSLFPNNPMEFCSIDSYSLNTIPTVANGSLDFADFDNDFDNDLLITGTLESGKPYTQIFENKGGQFVEYPSGLPQLTMGNAKWADINLDGKLDIAICGIDEFNIPKTSVYLQQDNHFVEFPTLICQLGNGWLDVGDIDNDGDLDLAISGIDRDGNNQMKIYKNLMGTNQFSGNTPPLIPSNLHTEIVNNTINFYWDGATDNSTPTPSLSYNLYVQRKDDGKFISSPMSNISTGYRKVVKMGNTSLNNQWQLKNLEPGEYVWSVQAIDNAFIGGPFAPVNTFKVCSLPLNMGTIAGTSTVCAGQNSVSYSVPAITNATSYLWTLPSGATGASTTNSITVNYSATAVSGNVTVKGHNDCGNGPESSLAVTVNSTINQDITMIAGWNIISSYTIPANPELKTIFQALIDDGKLKKVMDEAGKTIENFGAFGGWKNNIGNLVPAEGYKVNLTGNATLQLKGAPVELPFNISLSTGWNIVAYPCTNVQDALALTQPLINSGVIKKVMDESGKTIENFGAFGGWKNNIGNFVPGKGYKINVTSDCILTISANTTKASVTVSEVQAAVHFTKVFEGNGTDHMNVTLIDLQTSGLQTGDEIGIFDGENCVGAATIGDEQLKSGSISIPASANEGTGILVNGFTSGNTIGLQLYRGDQSFNLQTETLQGTLAFEKNGSVFVKVATSELPIVQINNEPDKFRCYPNPFNDELTVEIWNAEETIVEVGIYNLLGQRIKNLYNGTNMGNLTLKWNGSNESGQKVVPGVYLCKVNDQSLKILLKN